MNLFDLAAKITLDTGDYEKGISDALTGAQQLAGAIGNGLANAAKVGMAAVASAMAGIGAVTKSAVEGFGEYEQLVGGVETLFKSSAGVVREYAANAYKTAGMSANDYMDTVTGFSASLLQSLGGDTAAAADIADMAITDMSDNANKMGTDMAAIQYAYQGFAKQNYTMLDNLKLGYGGTQAEMLRLLDTANEINARQGIITDYQISNFADIVDAIHVVQTETGITGTTAAEASGTIQGSISAMKSAWQNLITGLANPDADMSVLVDNFVESFEIAFDNVQPAIETALINIGDVIAKIAPTILDKLPDLGGALLDSLANVVESTTGFDITPLTDGLKNAISGVLDVIKDLGAAFADGGIDGVIDALVQKFQDLTGLDLTPVVDAVRGIFSGIGEVGAAFEEGGIGGAIESIFTQLGDLTGLDLSGVSDMITGLLDTFKTLGAAFEEGGIGGVIDLVVGAFEDLTGIDLSSIIDGIGDFIRKIMDEAPQAIESFKQAIQGFKEKLDELGLSDLINTVAEKVGEFIGKFDGAAVIQTAADAVKWLGDNLEWIVPLFAGVVAAIAAYNVITTVANTVTTVFKVAMALLNAVMSANPIALVVTLIAGLIAAFITAYQTSDEFREKVDKAFAAIKEAIGNAVDAIAKFFGETLPNALSSAVDAIKNKVSDFIRAGKDLIQGFIDGVKEKFTSFKDTLGGIAEKGIDLFRGLFDEHSPSRVFKQIGMYAMEGLALGFEDGYDKFKSDIGKSIYGLIPDRISSSVDFAASSIGKASVGTVNGIMAAASSQGGSYNINLVVDGKTLAGVVYDPLNKIIKQKGEAAYA